MKYFASAVTDIGNTKKTNQDSVCVKIAQSEKYGQIAMVVLCDGMGGLDKGELASATVVKAFSKWFEEELPLSLKRLSWSTLSDEWARMAKEQNYLIGQYGNRIENSVGTTLTAMLFIKDKYLIAHVGDSRAYGITDSVNQLTEDQTFIAREIKAGRMTAEEAKIHPKRNMLLQCIGASRNVEPQMILGKTDKNSVYMLCSDGFRHVLTNEEIYENFNFDNLSDEQAMEKNSRYLIDLVKSRNEKDNITVALLKCYE